MTVPLKQERRLVSSFLQFLERMLTEAHQDGTLARRDKAAAAVDRRNPVRSTRRGQHFPPSPHPSPYGEGQPSERTGRVRGRRGVGDSRSGRGRGNPNPRRYDLSPLISSPCILSTPDVGEIWARLSLLADRWPEVTNDPWVLDTVTDGLKIDFISKPFQRRHLTMFPCPVICKRIVRQKSIVS
jgi:hypothetical protein